MSSKRGGNSGDVWKVEVPVLEKQEDRNYSNHRSSDQPQEQWLSTRLGMQNLDRDAY